MEESNLKQKIIQEMRLFLLYTAFLALFFSSLNTFQRLILGEYSISYLHYGYGLIEALLIAKIILIGESLRIGKNYETKPLIIPTLYKAVIFSILVLIFTVLEHFLTGYLKGMHSAEIYRELMDRGKDAILAKILVVFFVFILFFAFIETARVFGEGKLLRLFFGHNKTKN